LSRTDLPLASNGRGLSFPDGGVNFTTRLSRTGPLLERVAPIPENGFGGNGGSFAVLEMIPDGSHFPLTDLASLRLSFSEPLDPATVIYGESLSLETPDGELVPAQLLVMGENLTLDPEEPLAPGTRYQLSLTDSIRSTVTGASLNAGRFADFRFTPLDSESGDPLPLQVVSHNQGQRQSRITGELLNSVRLGSNLLGPDNLTFIGPEPGGTRDMIFANLASLSTFSERTPMSIPRGTLLRGTGVDVQVAGVQPAGLSSGEISVRFLSDATGFMVPNPYSDSSRAPRNVLLFVDMALNTQDTRSNSALGQALLNVPLVGTVAIENGVLSIDAVAVIAPEILGIDQATGLVSFRLEGFERASDSPLETRLQDTQGPRLSAWVPGDNSASLRPGDPLILFFDRPLLRSSLANAVSLLADGQPVPVSSRLNGSVLTLRPQQPLRHGVQYDLTINGLKGLDGQLMDPVATQGFTLAQGSSGDSVEQSPLVLTTLPGYPCAKTPQEPLSGDATRQGRCDGGRSTDDTLPVTEHPTDRPLIVRFSQNMDPDSLVADETVLLEQFADGAWAPMNDWVLETSAREIRLVPAQRWQQGRLYRYTLVSDPDGSASGIQSEAGLPLQTRLLSPTPRDFTVRDFGGPDLVNHFRGGEPASRTLAPLRNLPANDVNADLAINPQESPVPPVDGRYSATANTSGLDVVPGSVDSNLMADGNIGCEVGQTCPENKFIYLTGMLNTDISGQALDPGTDDRVMTLIDPSVLYTTDLDVHIRIDDTPLAACLFLCSAADLVGENQVSPTGPMMMRMRYGGENRDRPFPAFISRDDEGQLQIELELDVYLDAPYLTIDIDLTDLDHNLRSFPIDNLKLQGPIDFLNDGRMQIALRNAEPVDLNVEVRGSILGGLGDVFAGSPDTDLTLRIPPGELVLNYLSPYTQP
ncbi:MAG: Ig-like domain-containing protein, partial [Oleiphilaceae bacterium]|nr:Ig-like domain-containing protein [Oleiphilaceae bacterium]